MLSTGAVGESVTLNPPPEGLALASSHLGLVGDVLPALMPTRRVRIVVLVIEFFLKFLLLLSGFRRVLRGGWWIVALFHGARVDESPDR